jgi:HK97 family phage major capsid protein/HK97 family phage prohead protease
MPVLDIADPFIAARDAARAKGEQLRRSRVATVGKIDAEARTVELSCSSDVDLERWPGFFEKLDHSTDAVDLTRFENAANVLFNHDWDEVIGVILSAKIEDGKIRIVVKFGNSQRAKDVWADVKDGVMRNVSIGYEVLEEELTRSDENSVHYTVIRWAPYETSFVTVPADISVGVGRSLKNEKPNTRTTMSKPDPEVDTTKPTARETVVVTEKPTEVAFKDARAILDIGAKYNAREEAAEAVAAGKTLDEFKSIVLERFNKAVAVRTDSPLGLSDKEIQGFMFSRLIAATVAQQTGHSDAKRLKDEAAFEFEVVEAAAAIRVKKTGRSPKGMFIPAEILNRGKVKLTDEQRQAFLAQRAIIGLSVGDSNASATTVPFLDTASFAELLRPECLLMNLATVVSGLEGDYELPKQVSGSAGGWVTEGVSVSGQDAIFQQLQADPNTVGGFIDITRRASLQSALPIESIIRTGLAAGIGQTVDLAGYYGTGSSGQPLGLTLTDGVKIKEFIGVSGTNGSDGVNPDWTEVVDMETIISDSNVKLDPQNGIYLTNSGGRGWAKTRQKFPTTPTGFTIWEPGNTINGYRTGISNQILKGHWFLGNFKELYMLFWSGLDMLVDPFKFSESGTVRIRALQDMDYLCRRPEAFSFGYNPTNTTP